MPALAAPVGFVKYLPDGAAQALLPRLHIVQDSLLAHQPAAVFLGSDKLFVDLCLLTVDLRHLLPLLVQALGQFADHFINILKPGVALRLLRQKLGKLRLGGAGPTAQPALLPVEAVAVRAHALNLVMKLSRPPNNIDDPGLLVIQRSLNRTAFGADFADEAIQFVKPRPSDGMDFFVIGKVFLTRLQFGIEQTVLFAQSANLLGGVCLAPRQLLEPAPQKIDALVLLFNLTPRRNQRIVPAINLALGTYNVAAQFTQRRVASRHLRRHRTESLLHPRKSRLLLAALRDDLVIFRQRIIYPQFLQTLAVFQIIASLARLQLDTAKLLFDLAHDIRQTQQILLGPIQLAKGLLLVRLELAYPGCLLEDNPPVDGGFLQQLVDLTLFDNGIGAHPDTRVHEQFANIPETADLVVDQVLAVAASVESPAYLQRALLDPHASHVGKDHANLGHTAALATARTAEYHVGHLTAAKALRALVAKNPLDRVDNIALAAAVWTHDRSNRATDVEFGLVGKALEAVENYLVKLHHPISMLNTSM